MRRALARRSREARGSSATADTGALGISSWMTASAGRTLRTATSMPPALTFRAVANSRDSLPSLSRLRTNTGMAKGRRDHLRRSVWGRAVFKRAAPACESSTSRAKCGLNSAEARTRIRSAGGFRPKKPHSDRRSAAFCSLYIRLGYAIKNYAEIPGSARFCYS